ncbi:MAG UNVERIFIED_CONTAM: hypothetical protein LVR18_18455 [Planctomycetaceae bacterium]|jgi:hypothetical protein
MVDSRLVNVSVLVDENRWNRISEVVTALEQQGFVLRETLDSIGVLQGTVAASRLADLAQTPGVVSAEAERSDYHTQ